MSRAVTRSGAAAPVVLLALLLAASAACGDDSAATGRADTEAADTTSPADATGTATTAPDATPELAEPLAFCAGATTFAWDPDDDAFLAAFPDDALTIADPLTTTGLRVHLGDPAWLAAQPRFFQPVWRQLELLDGFGVSAAIMLRFSAPIAASPSGSATAASDRILLIDLTTGDALPYETEHLDEGATVLVWPMRPLAEGRRYAVIATTRLPDAAGDCIAPSSALQALLSPDDAAVAASPSLSALRPAYEALVQALARHDLRPDDVSAATVFTTQTFSDVTLSQRDDILERAYAWKDRPTCAPDGDVVYCTGSFFAMDYRIEGDLGTAREPGYAPASYRLTVHLWLPAERAAGAPAPLLIFGHGLGGSARDTAPLGELAAELGLATMAISAPRHGDHPTVTSTDPQAVFTSFFGIDLATFSIDGMVFRENLRQAAFDKLQVLALLTADPDVDGDGAPDVDVARVAYWGISLGGILGPNFVAMSDDVDLAVLSVAGARLISVVSEAADFRQLFDLLAQVSGGRDALLRQAPVAQTLIDGADPVSWAAHLFADPIGRPDAEPPHVLVQMVMDDSTVPNITTRSLARALEVPQVPTIISPIDLLASAPTAPVRANVPQTRTAGLFQFDRYSTEPGGRARRATHGGVFSGIEAIDQVTRFIETWLGADDHVPTIFDLYAEYGTPPL